LTDPFCDDAVDLGLLRERAYNHRWAEQPEDVIPLTAADPDFPAPSAVREAIIDYAQGGYFSYGPPAGLPEFRETISEVVLTRKGIGVPAGRVLPIDSAARAMFLLAETVLEPGDEAIIFDPVDFLFKRSVEAAGGVPVYCRIDPATGTFDPDQLESLVSPRTRMIGVCNPHNPVGRVLRSHEVQLLAEFAARHDLWIMNDEIWSDIVYEDSEVRFHSLHALPDELTRKTVTIYGFSKAFAMAGLRAAFMLCPDDAAYEKLFTASQMPTTAGGLSPIVQVAATAAFRDGWEWVASFVDHLRTQRDYAMDRISAMNGMHCARPEGTYVLFPNIASYGLSSLEMVETLSRQARVALVPGTSAFFGPGSEGHVRICFATSHEILREGLDRVENWIDRRKEHV
jgi:aspartate/methionine/tyrosine aminotransferase